MQLTTELQLVAQYNVHRGDVPDAALASAAT